MKVFLGIYTCKYKQYCDVEFFDRILTLNPMPSQIFIVDNSLDNKGAYLKRIKQLMAKCSVPWEAVHIEEAVKKGESKSYPARVICKSANKVREKFLKSDADAMWILESDVFPIADDCVSMLAEHMDKYAAIGGIYYEGFHKPEWFKDDFNEIVPLETTTYIILSGCTLYRRDLVEKTAFRWGMVGDVHLLPDACYSHDLDCAGLKRANYTKIKCRHLCDENKMRGWSVMYAEVEKKARKGGEGDDLNGVSD